MNVWRVYLIIVTISLTTTVTTWFHLQVACGLILQWRHDAAIPCQFCPLHLTTWRDCSSIDMIFYRIKFVHHNVKNIHGNSVKSRVIWKLADLSIRSDSASSLCVIEHGGNQLEWYIPNILLFAEIFQITHFLERLMPFTFNLPDAEYTTERSFNEKKTAVITLDIFFILMFYLYLCNAHIFLHFFIYVRPSKSTFKNF